ncbi:hypothetical protein BV22DRAFT_1047340 [Leucogyrophana mollusca]|uniref:Uncharacterized protein n=1 Tax=Leucogyrophana mollusca TaxID=85980 RepID=A0ACB8BGI8_9AGAM|nr:hypothetical protein BV22DRAFT_1047340 [Leucogyrophana mollusca]
MTLYSLCRATFDRLLSQWRCGSPAHDADTKRLGKYCASSACELFAYHKKYHRASCAAGLSLQYFTELPTTTALDGSAFLGHRLFPQAGWQAKAVGRALGGRVWAKISVIKWEVWIEDPDTKNSRIHAGTMDEWRRSVDSAPYGLSPSNAGQSQTVGW